MRRLRLWLARKLLPAGHIVTPDPRPMLPHPDVAGTYFLSAQWSWVRSDPPRFEHQGPWEESPHFDLWGGRLAPFLPGRPRDHQH